jgi:hypothetical protein
VAVRLLRVAASGRDLGQRDDKETRESKGVSATSATPLLLSAYMARADTAITEVTFQVSQTVVLKKLKEFRTLRLMK